MEIKSSTLCDFIYGKEVSLEKLVDLGGEVLLDKESNEDIYEDVHVFKPKFNSISEVYEELKDKKLNLDKTIDCAAPHYRVIFWVIQLLRFYIVVQRYTYTHYKY